MKKILSILTASTILLAACGNDNHEEKHSTHHDKKHKSENKEKEKNNSKKDSKNFSDSNNENENNTNSSSINNEQASNDETSNDNDELNSEQSTQNQTNQQQPAQTQTNQQQQSQGTGYDPNNPYMNMPNQEWRKNTGTGLSSGETQTKFLIESGQYDGDDGDQILEALEYYQNKYVN